ncbi:unnamed protein product [Cylicostephanus goldi]|uniref:EF-hand domain-containing protein n=1 Tax=Cylicostephanus goldi TaxID=71465 RepID=A0A3P7PLD1_CYLGO|nr:unnamed protein product [Cylicostephanus goldi]
MNILPEFFNFSVNRNQIVRLYSRFLSLDKKGQGFLSRDDFLNVPELAVNPLGDRIVDAFFTLAGENEQQLNFRQFVRILAHFQPINRSKKNALNGRKEKLKCELVSFSTISITGFVIGDNVHWVMCVSNLYCLVLVTDQSR